MILEILFVVWLGLVTFVSCLIGERAGRGYRGGPPEERAAMEAAVAEVEREMAEELARLRAEGMA